MAKALQGECPERGSVATESKGSVTPASRGTRSATFFLTKALRGPLRAREPNDRVGRLSSPSDSRFGISSFCWCSPRRRGIVVGCATCTSCIAPTIRSTSARRMTSRAVSLDTMTAVAARSPQGGDRSLSFMQRSTRRAMLPVSGSASSNAGHGRKKKRWSPETGPYSSGFSGDGHRFFSPSSTRATNRNRSVHGVTRLPRHALSAAFGGKVSPMCPEYGVTSLSGRTSIVPTAM